MTVSASQIEKAENEDTPYWGYMQNLDTAAVVADEIGVKFYHLCALFEKESGGRNIYGHDKGGALSGFPNEVNQGNYEVFRWLVFTKGQTSNGVGPMQLTFKGFFTDMEVKHLKPWDVHDSVTYGADLWLSYYRIYRNNDLSRDDAIVQAGRKYNGSLAYGERLLILMDKWFGIVGKDDYA